MTTDFHKLWADPATPNRERKRLLAYIIEDATLHQDPGRRNHQDPRPLQGWQDRDAHDAEPKVLCAAGQDADQRSWNWSIKLLDDHIYSEIADILNAARVSSGRHQRDRDGTTLALPPSA